MMQKIVRFAAAIALAVATLGLLAGSTANAAPSSTYTCGGTPTNIAAIPAGTYSALVMPAGSACAVYSGVVNVTAPVTLGSSSILGVLGGSLNVSGGLTVGPGAIFATPQNTTPVSIRGPVTVQSVGVFLLGVETPGGPLFGSIGGPVNAVQASSVQIHNTTVSGPVTSTGGGADNALFDQLANQGFPQNFFDLEDNHIGGPVSVNGYGGEWAGVIRDAISGPFTFTNNVQPLPQDEWDIGSLVVYGPATCSNNSPVPNTGDSPGGPSTVYGPTLGNQAATCTSAI